MFAYWNYIKCCNEQEMRSGNFMGFRDWAKLKVVDDSTFKDWVVVVYNKCKETFDIEDCCTSLVNDYMLALETYLNFNLVDVESFVFSIKIGKNGILKK